MLVFDFILLCAAFASIQGVTAAPTNSTGNSTAPTATIDAGVVIGTQTKLPGASVYVNKYLGIPFAASPIRFSPPVKPTPWSKPYEAKQLGPACIQQFNYPELSRNFTMAAFNFPPPVESEDCLHLNVFAPATPLENGRLRPVMFWIYGGALQFGWNGNPGYDGTSFATNQDVIIVATNYRTNVFGFPRSPELPLTERNLGFLDQRLALDWVQRNIRSFGGDPGQVTLFGESAGASSVDELVTTFPPPQNPPFRAAIMESGQASFYVDSSNSSPASWNSLISALNCNTTDALACARSYPASVLKLIIEVHALPFQPVADNFTSLRFPELARKTGNVARVPIMTGTNMNEGTLFTLQSSNATTVLESYGVPENIATNIINQYPIGSEGVNSTSSQLSTIYTDFIFHCPASFLAEHSKAAGIPTYRYLYNASFPNVQIVGGFDLGVFHSAEITLVFGNYQLYSGNGGPTADEVALSKMMQKAWADFAKDPSQGPALGSWGQFPNVEVISASQPYFESRNASLLDQRCEPYRVIYDFVEG